MKAINHAFLKVYCKRYLLIASIVMSCRRCLAFVCAKLLQTELDIFVSHWNSHLPTEMQTVLVDILMICMTCQKHLVSIILIIIMI